MMFDFLKPHIKLSKRRIHRSASPACRKNSDTLKLAGERGFIPMSLNLNPAYVGSHWDSVEAGAAAIRPHAEPQGLADGARGFCRRYR